MKADVANAAGRSGSVTVALVAPMPAVREHLRSHLERLGFVVWGVDAVQSFYRRWLASRADVVIVDTVATGDEGLQLVSHVRPANSVGCIVLAQHAHDRAAGLDAGADLSLGLPPDMQELSASVRAVRRHYLASANAAADAAAASADHEPSLPGSMPEPNTLIWKLDSTSCCLTVPGGRASIALTTKEYDLLVVLMSSPLLSISKAEILSLWDVDGAAGDYHRVESALSRLRKKVETVCGQKLPVRSNFGRGLAFHAPCRVV
jgi:DNA-binding response OmpR family regulator